MLVVLSDLHFSEAKSTQIGSFRFNRNLSPETYEAYFSEINQFAKANQINQIDFVLAGDILEISRSSIWLESENRPYTNNDDVLPGSATEETILEVIQAIGQEKNVSETLTLFRNIKNQFDMSVRLHLMLGNHDRLANATPKIREEVRRMFGLEGGSEEIDYYLIFRDNQGLPFCLVRHGHEYDSTNFMMDFRKKEIIPPDIPKSVYGKASLGDITTIEYGAALPWLFEKQYGEEAILTDPTLLAVYQRLMEFDDVRPTTAWIAYLFSTPGVSRRETWRLVKPAFTGIINTLITHKQFITTLKQSAAMSGIGRVLLILTLKTGLFKNGIPYWLVKVLMKIVSRSIKVKSQAQVAKKEAILWDQDANCRCVISGHSHFAEVALLSAENNEEKYYINSGTWRNVIPATKNYQDFGRLRALTKVMVFYPSEKDPLDGDRDWAFHYMSGVSFGDYRHLLS